MTAINPLANPKGVVRLCELCQKPAYIQCCDCRVTFYWWVALAAIYTVVQRSPSPPRLKTLTTLSYEIHKSYIPALHHSMTMSEMSLTQLQSWNMRQAMSK